MKMHEDPPAVITHAAHKAHALTLVTTAGHPPFRCDACKEPGSGNGRRYRCSDDGCDFDLHTSCALAPKTLTHPLLDDLDFILLLFPQPPVAADAAPVCAACGLTAAGLVYRCSAGSKKKAGLYLHPCCAALRTETVLAGGHRAHLCAEAKARCVVCGEKKKEHDGHHHPFFSSARKVWAYRWCYGGLEGYLHVGCMKKIAAQSWEQACDVDGGAVMEASVPIMRGLLMRGRDKEAEGIQKVSQGIQIATSVVGAVSAAASSS